MIAILEIGPEKADMRCLDVGKKIDGIDQKTSFTGVSGRAPTLLSCLALTNYFSRVVFKKARLISDSHF